MLKPSEKRFLIWTIPIWILCVLIFTLVWNRYTSSPQNYEKSTPKQDTIRVEDLGPPFIVRQPLPVEYIEIINGCSITTDSTCVNAFSSPTTTSNLITPLRTGTVLKVSDTLTIDNELWYEIEFDEWLRYPFRISSPLYVHASGTRNILNEGPLEITTLTSTSSKRIVVDRTKQTLHAYDGDTLFMEQTISTGREITPTPRGIFTVFKKTPSRYMQGPIPGISPQYFDLPGVPWNLYFTKEGAVIHGAYWHNSFGQRWSSGCVNLPPDKAETLYHWADIGTIVEIRD